MIEASNPNLWARQLAATLGAAARVVVWKPMAATSVGAVAFVALGAPTGVPFRLSLAGACIAASAAYMIDDPAAATMASSPTRLLRRRAARAALAATLAGLTWIAALVVSSLRVDGIAIWPAALQLAAFLVLAIAVSATATEIGDGTEGAIAGAVVTMACFASTFLPEHPWLPFPPDPTAPGAAGRLLLILAAAAVVFAFVSRDPAVPAIRPALRVLHHRTQQGGTS